MDELIEYLASQFHSVNQFSDEWVNSVIDGNFTEYEAISAAVKPEFFEQELSTQLELYKKLSRLLLNFQDTSELVEIWQKMYDREIPAKKLALLFWYSIEAALAKESSGLEIKAGIRAASCYLYLSCLKGAQAYHIFNPYLFEKCLELFRMIFRCVMFEARGANTKSKGKTKGKGKSKRYNEEHEDSEMAAPALERSELHELLEISSSSLFVMLNKVALSAYKEASEATALFIRDIARMDATKETCVAPCDSLKEFDRLTSIADRSFALMHRLAEDKHSHGGVLVYSRLIFPRLAYWGFDLNIVSSSSSIPASYTMWKELMCRFVAIRIEKGSEPEMNTIIKILDNLYCRCTDRQDYRSKVSSTLVQVLAELPKNLQYDFIRKVHIFSKNQKTALRNFTVEIVPLILKNIDLAGVEPSNNDEEINDQTVVTEQTRVNTNDAADSDDSLDEEMLARRRKEEARKKKEKAKKKVVLERIDPASSLYQSLIRCCVDKSSGVRGRAIIQMAQLLNDSQHKQNMKDHAQKMFEETPALFTGKHTENVDNLDPAAEEINDDILDDSVDEISNVLLHVIMTAMKDDKAAVRKSGVIAMQSYFNMLENLDEFNQACNLLKKCIIDSSVLVRKQAADSLNSILSESYAYKNELEVMWLKTVLPMINDREQSVVTVAAKLISDTIVAPLLNGDEVVWPLLNRIEQEDNHRRLLVRALFHQSREGNLSERIVDVLLKKLLCDSNRTDVIWMMLAELSVVFKINPSKALDHWYTLNEDECSNKVRYIAKVLTASTAMLTDQQKIKLIDDLRHRISNYYVEAGHISSVYLCLAKLLDAVGEEATGWALLREFGLRVLSDGKKQLRKHLDKFSSQLDIENDEGLSSMETKLIRVITTIGEVIQFSPTLLNSCGELINALKIIMASADIQADEEVCHKIINSAVPSVNPTPLPSRTGTALGIYGHNEGGSQPLSSIGSQPLSSQGQPIIPPHMINKAGHFIGVQLFTSVVRAYCVLAIGKFCLMDEKLAKQCVPVLVRQLKINEDHIIRNNVVFVICDLCIRYTLLVDRYSPIIASCLKDRSTLVRHHTLESLTNLIKEQFIRWEGQIMYRFVSTILDENKTIREYAEFCLKDVLLLQFPGMFYNHFIECLIYFNDVPRKYMPGASEDLEVDASLKFSLSGKRNYAARMTLYKFMLATFDDKQKFMTMSHICEQILRPIYCGEMSFDLPHVKTLLADSFDIMSCKEIKLNMDVGKGNEEEEDEPSPAIVAAAKKMITDAFRKGIIQSIMPPLLEMRTFLMEQKSPLIKGCFAVLRAICREHQEQIDEFLAGDKQLKAEIEFDIKRFTQYEIYQRAAAKKAAEEAKLLRQRQRKSLAAASILVANKTLSNNGLPAEKKAAECLNIEANRGLSTVEQAETIASEDAEMALESNDNINSDNKAHIGTPTKTTSENVDMQDSNSSQKATVSSPVTLPGAEDGQMDVDSDEVVVTDIDLKSKDIVVNDEDIEENKAMSKRKNVSVQERRSTRVQSRNNSTIVRSGKEDIENTQPADLSKIQKGEGKLEENKNTSVQTRRLKKADSEKINEENTFTVPAPGRMSVRKRTRASIVNSMSEDAILARAISTPNKPMDPNLTFADLNLSAIPADNDNAKPSRLTRGRRTSLDRITE